jgi:hypothetical protein
MDRLYFCLLGHLFHLARGELLRIGTALRLPEAAAANASVLQLGKAAFAPASAGASSSGGTKAALDSASSSPTKPSSASKQQQQQRSSQGQTSAAAAASLTAGVDLLTQAAAAGSLSPRMVAQLQELLLTPLCGFSQMINKYADGSSGALTYEVHTPKLHEVRCLCLCCVKCCKRWRGTCWLCQAGPVAQLCCRSCPWRPALVTCVS